MTFDEWWKGNAITPEMMGSLEAWARVVWETGHANGYGDGARAAANNPCHCYDHCEDDDAGVTRRASCRKTR